MIKNKEKSCLFFASDYHFELISLPYISKELKEQKNVVIVTENNLSKTIGKIVDSLNLSESEKENIINLDWNNNDFDKFKKLKKDNKDTVIFVKGNENYVKNINENLKNLVNIENSQIIDCYDVNSIQNRAQDIIKDYTNILSTTGIEKIV